MKYTEEQIENLINDQFIQNKNEIKRRLRFLLDNYTEQDQVISPDVWYCFEEARHSFMIGNYISSIIMSAVTIERYIAKLLEMPYVAPVAQEEAHTCNGIKLINKAFDVGILNDEIKIKLEFLNQLRDDYVHGIDSTIHKRPQFKDPKCYIPIFLEQDNNCDLIENNAKKAILILFQTMDSLHYTKLNYF